MVLCINDWILLDSQWVSTKCLFEFKILSVNPIPMNDVLEMPVVWRPERWFNTEHRHKPNDNYKNDVRRTMFGLSHNTNDKPCVSDDLYVCCKQF